MMLFCNSFIERSSEMTMTTIITETVGNND